MIMLKCRECFRHRVDVIRLEFWDGQVWNSPKHVKVLTRWPIKIRCSIYTDVVELDYTRSGNVPFPRVSEFA